MKHLSTLIAVKNLTIIQFTKIIQDLFYLDEFILDSLIIHLENCQFIMMNQLLLFVFNIKIMIMNIFLTKKNKIYIFLLINVIINLSI